jgi:hypothetical protein
VALTYTALGALTGLPIPKLSAVSGENVVVGAFFGPLKPRGHVRRWLMPKSPDQYPDNADFAAQELADASVEERALMLVGIAKALTRMLLHDRPGTGAREISVRVTCFIEAVRQKVEEIDRSRSSSS